MPSARVPRSVLALILTGLVLRVVLLPLPGTLDVSVWKIWAFAASTDDPARLYGVGGSPPGRRELAHDRTYCTVDYPILALDVMAVVGRTYRFLRPAFQNDTALVVAVKLPAVLADVGLGVLLWWFGRRQAVPHLSRLLTTYWLAPAILLNGAALGYLDPLSALPATAAFVAGGAGAWVLAGVLGAAGALTKAQAIVPSFALFWWGFTVGRRPGVRVLGGAAACATACLAPVALRGAVPNFVEAMRSLTRHDMVSGNACNIWWLYTWVIRAYYDLSWGAWVAFTEPVRIVALSTVEELGHVSPRPFGLVALMIVTAWACWRFTRAVRGATGTGFDLGTMASASHDWPFAAAFASLLVHSYFSLAVPVHENHLLMAVPLAALAALRIPEYIRVAWVVGGVQALNLFVFYGISEGIGWLPPRNATVLDTTVVVAIVSVGVFVWHLRVFSRLTRLLPAV